jgi:2-phospho-L-lactate transferase/gluconeogenesis factor (CofD/UPF0052 family)
MVNNKLEGRGAANRQVNVVLFSGGRGSSVLSKQLINHPQVELTLAINGYDDGLSTGEVRRFLGDSLGPSDFRKNASRLAKELQTCPAALIDILDLRFPVGYTAAEALKTLAVDADPATANSEFQKAMLSKVSQIGPDFARSLGAKLQYFLRELESRPNGFSFSDCSLGNLVFAGCFLEMRRDFNAAVADYCKLLGLAEGLIENVTDGANAHLVALDHDHRLLATEADIVDANRRNHIKDIFLIERPLPQEEQDRLAARKPAEILEFLRARSVLLKPNERLLSKIASADLIIYSPGTQHSSLFPSYLTPSLGSAIAQNLTAIKLLITNLQEDADIADISAVDLIEKAAYYLKERDTQPTPTPCLITHYLLNDHQHTTDEKPYVPLGRIENLEDPRLVRIGAYEERGAGRHDAAKILTPYIESILRRDEQKRVAVWLLGTESLNKLCQSILEMMRGGIGDLPVSISVFYHSRESFSPSFTRSLPFDVRNVASKEVGETEAFTRSLGGPGFDYVVLFESSGMYRGEDIVNLVSLLTNRRLDAVWGSRRLSVKDIQESYKLRYRKHRTLGAISYAGSHLLSLACLAVYGRYVSDTLTGIRAIRASYLKAGAFDLNDASMNQSLLSHLLGERAEVFETPVQFFSLSPDKVRRTTVADGLQSLMAVLRGGLRSRRARKNESSARGQDEMVSRNVPATPNLR